MMAQKTLLIGLDGATFTLLDPFMAGGVMPFLKSFAERGVRAELRSVVPPLTPPAWTSVLTGRSPGYHGIFDFFQADTPGSISIRLATSGDIRVDHVAKMINQHGLRANIINFPVHFPPAPIDGVVIAGWMPWRQLRLGCHPPDLYDRLKALPGFNPRELAMDMGLEARATEGCAEEEYVDWAALHARREERWLEVLKYLDENDSSEFTAILLDGPDKVQHLCWRFLDPVLWPVNPTPEEERIREASIDYYRQLDSILEELVESAGSEATIVMVSDHGFGASTEVFHVNTWLEQAGYLVWSKDVTSELNEQDTLGMGHISRHSRWLDWDRTKAYVATPTSNGIHIVRAEQHDGRGVPAADYPRFRAELLDALLSYVDEKDGNPVVTAAATREDAFAGPAGELAPDLTLSLRDGGLVSILPSDTPLKPRPRPVGTHRPLGVFLAAGPGIRRNVMIEELSVMDVAPIVLHSLGIAVPESLEGHVPGSAYETDYLAKRPVELVPPGNGIEGERVDTSQQIVYDEEAEAVLMARLRELGYIE
ncbi:MAG: alkaline phosphatase family protein [Chloroflexota bacterium]|nr:alkaline phosphatase family protein [Chloroflexota bacterium]